MAESDIFHRIDKEREKPAQRMLGFIILQVENHFFIIVRQFKAV